MDSVINKLTEIEDAASAIVEHAQEQKSVLDREYEEKRKAFDAELEEKTQAQIQAIRDGLEEEKERLMKGQADGNAGLTAQLRQEYEANHTRYAREILARITEV